MKRNNQTWPFENLYFLSLTTKYMKLPLINFPSGPGCLNGRQYYPMHNSIGFDSIYGLDSSFHPLNDWTLEYSNKTQVSSE